MSERSSTPSLADVQRQWWEMAEAAAKPWQEAAKAFAEPWRDLAESFGARTDVQGAGQEAWDRLASTLSALAEQQQRIAEAIFDAMRTGAEEMQKAMEQAVEQMTAMARGAGGGGGSSGSSAKRTSSSSRKATGATKASKATEK
jgi:hypothetical protein